MEAVVERENLKEALARVKRNKGAAGIDGMSVDDLPIYLKEHWPTIRTNCWKALTDRSRYGASRYRGIGRHSALGIPTVLDRLIQQAVLQVAAGGLGRNVLRDELRLPAGRSAHQAVEQAQAYIASGHGFVVDIDLEKFFDRVNHDILMGLVAKRVADKRLLKLIRGFLTAG